MLQPLEDSQNRNWRTEAKAKLMASIFNSYDVNRLATSDQQEIDFLSGDSGYQSSG